MANLNNRSRGYELSSAERNLTFVKEFENIGYVRYKNKNEKSFFLDPSPFYTARKNEYFIIKNCSMSREQLKNEKFEEGMLIEVTVLETDKKNNFKDNEIISSTQIKYVSSWKPVSPNKIRCNSIISKDEFLNYLSIPIGDQWDIEDIRYCAGLYIVSSPQLINTQKGGINTVLLANNNEGRKLAAFKKITSIVPNEFKKTSSRNYYYTTEKKEQPDPINSNEVNIAYFNVTDVPVHIPLPFDVKYKKTENYIDNFDTIVPLAQGYMIDSLLFKPYIPDSLIKRVEESMYFILDEFISTNDVPFYQDIGSVMPKLTTAFARLNYEVMISVDDIKKSRDTWMSVMEKSRKISKNTHNVDELYRDNSYTMILRHEIRELYYTGVPLIITAIKAKTKVPEWVFDETLEKLSIAGVIYYKNNNEIKLLDY